MRDNLQRVLIIGQIMGSVLPRAQTRLAMGTIIVIPIRIGPTGPAVGRTSARWAAGRTVSSSSRATAAATVTATAIPTAFSFSFSSSYAVRESVATFTSLVHDWRTRAFER